MSIHWPYVNYGVENSFFLHVDANFKYYCSIFVNSTSIYPHGEEAGVRK